MGSMGACGSSWATKRNSKIKDQRSNIKDVLDAWAPLLAGNWRCVQYDLFDFGGGALGT